MIRAGGAASEAMRRRGEVKSMHGTRTGCSAGEARREYKRRRRPIWNSNSRVPLIYIAFLFTSELVRTRVYKQTRVVSAHTHTHTHSHTSQRRQHQPIRVIGCWVVGMGKKKLSRFRFTPFYLLGSLSSPSPHSTVREMIAVWFIGSLERPSIYTHVYNTYIYIIYSTREA